MKILDFVHASLFACHSSFHKFLQHVRANCDWPRLKIEVKRFKSVRFAKRIRSRMSTLLVFCNPCQFSQQIWIDVFMGFVDDLPLSKDYYVIMVVMDMLSKYAYFMTLKNPFTTLEVASLFLDVWLITYMACSRVLFQMEVLLLQVCFGGNYSSCRVLVSFIFLHITLKMMVKVKLLMNAWSIYWDIFLGISLDCGLIG